MDRFSPSERACQCFRATTRGPSGPKKNHHMKTRGGDVYKISKGFSERFVNSAIPYMQRLLNRDKKNQLKVLKTSTLSPTNYACSWDILL